MLRYGLAVSPDEQTILFAAAPPEKAELMLVENVVAGRHHVGAWAPDGSPRLTADLPGSDLYAFEWDEG